MDFWHQTQTINIHHTYISLAIGSSETLCPVYTPSTTGHNIDALTFSLQCRHNERDGVSDHQPHDFLFYRLFRRRSKKIPKLRVTGLWAGNSPVTGEFPAQRASNAENGSIWRRHYVLYFRDKPVRAYWVLGRSRDQNKKYESRQMSTVPFSKHGSTLIPVWMIMTSIMRYLWYHQL